MRRLLTVAVTIALSLSLLACGHEHTWADATCTDPRTCTECGETEGEPLGHKWIEATCTEPKTCEVCGETEGEPLGHLVDVGFCSRCNKIANESLIKEVYDEMDKGFKEGEKAIKIINAADTSSLTKMYDQISSASSHFGALKAHMENAYEKCGDYEGLSSLKAQANLVIKAIPDNPKGHDKDSIISWLKDEAELIKIMGGAASELADYATELSKAQ